jgi:hypothetical protein
VVRCCPNPTPGRRHRSCLDWLAALCCTQQRWQTAALLAGAASGVREAMGAPLDAAYLADPDRYLETARRALGQSA